MSSMVPEQYGDIGPWQRYIEREHQARAGYLAVVQRAHHEYLTGPWPDRDSYQHVEQSAWLTYYAAGREAWRIYRQELAPPPPPPAAPGPSDFWTADRVPDTVTGKPWPAHPEFHPNQEGN